VGKHFIGWFFFYLYEKENLVALNRTALFSLFLPFICGLFGLESFLLPLAGILFSPFGENWLFKKYRNHGLFCFDMLALLIP